MEGDPNEKQSLQSKVASAVSKITESTLKNEQIPESIPANGYSRLSLISGFFNGMGVGLLLGLLLGLAVSPVVSGIIGTLSSLLVVLLGLNENYLNPVKSIRIGSFGLFCVIGILSGKYLVNNNSFAPSLEKFYDEYREIGFSDTVARDLIAYQKFRLIPEGFKFSIPAGTDSLMNQQFQSSRTVMFSAEVNASQCIILKSSNENTDYVDLAHNFTLAGGTWAELANDIDPELPEKTRSKTLLLLRDIFCESEETGTIKVQFSPAMQKLNSGDPLEKIRQTILSDGGRIWNDIASGIDQQIDPADQLRVYLSLTKILCHD
ncbi:MAG: hypothetical protein U5K79_16570 [Cyclobacteriaceae bacterium]|nr:hypothetical protein [Cyclobacteriaceae bacterium]